MHDYNLQKTMSNDEIDEVFRRASEGCEDSINIAFALSLCYIKKCCRHNRYDIDDIRDFIPHIHTLINAFDIEKGMPATLIMSSFKSYIWSRVKTKKNRVRLMEKYAGLVDDEPRYQPHYDNLEYAKSALWECMYTLQDHHADVIMKYFFHNMTLKEISIAKKCSINNVHRILRTALSVLKTKMAATLNE